MTGTRRVLFVIPAKAGIQNTRFSESSEPLNLGSTYLAVSERKLTPLRSKFKEGGVAVCTADSNTCDWKLKEKELLHEKEKKLKSQQKNRF